MSGGNVKFSKKAVTVVVLSIFIATYLAGYTIMAHTTAARHIYEDPDGKIVAWRSGPSGSLFPWPREPGMLEVLTKLNDVDLFIYRYFIKTWVLVGLSILMWAVTGLAIFKIKLRK